MAIINFSDRSIYSFILCVCALHLSQLLLRDGVNAQYQISEISGVYSAPCHLIATVSGIAVYFKATLNLTREGRIADTNETALGFHYRWQFSTNDLSCSSLALLVEFDGSLTQEGLPGSNYTNFNVNLTGIHGTPLSSLASTILTAYCASSPSPSGWTVGARRVVATKCANPAFSVPGVEDCSEFRSSLFFTFDSMTTLPEVALASLWTFNGSKMFCGEDVPRFMDIKDDTNDLMVLSAGTPPSIPLCVHLPSTSKCAAIIDYNVEVPVGQTLDSLEAGLFVQATPIAWSALQTDSCRAYVSAMTCGLSYFRCASQSQVLCPQTCDDIGTHCNGVEIQSLNALLGAAGFPPDYTLMCAPANSTSPTECMLGPTVSADSIASFNQQPLQYGRCEQYTGKVCENVVDYPIYVPGGNTSDDLEAEARAKFFFLFAVAPQGACLVSLARYACSQVFLRCDNTAVVGSIAPFPRLPCQSVCQSYLDDCSSFIQLDYRLQPNCSGEGTYISGQPNFPVNMTRVNPDVTIYTPCNAGIQSTNISVYYECLWPTVKPENPGYTNFINGGSCSIPCHIPTFPDTDYGKMDITIRVWAPFSVFGLFFTILTIAMFTDRRHARAQQYLMNMLICLAPTYIIVCIALIIHPHNNQYGVFDSVCRDNANTWLQGENSFCDAEAIFTTFSVISASIWLFAYVVDLFLTMTFIAQKMPERTHKYILWFYRVWAFGSALIFLVGAGAEGQLAGSSFSPWCDIGGDWSRYMWRYLGIVQLVGAVMLLVSLALLIRMCGHSRTLDGASLAIYIRPIAFMTIFTAFFLYGFGFSIYSTVSETVWADGLKNWIVCLVVLQPGGFVDECGPALFVPEFHWIITIQVFAMQGTIALLLVGLSVRNLELWRDWLTWKIPALKRLWCCSGEEHIRSQITRPSKLSKQKTADKTKRSEGDNTQQELSRVAEVAERMAAISAQENSTTHDSSSRPNATISSKLTQTDNDGGQSMKGDTDGGGSPVHALVGNKRASHTVSTVIAHSRVSDNNGGPNKESNEENNSGSAEGSMVAHAKPTSSETTSTLSPTSSQIPLTTVALNSTSSVSDMK